MPQSQLPDLNTLWLKWMDNCNNCLLKQDYLGAIASVFHINAVFGSDNRIEFNTAKYNELIKEQMKILCSHCKKETNCDGIKFYDLLLSDIASMLTNEKYIKVWKCPNCNTTNSHKDTEFIKETFARPRYLGVLPDPPEQSFGITGRRGFERKARSWIRLALDEISYSLGVERREYIPLLERNEVMDDVDNN